MCVTECTRMHTLSWENGFQGLQLVFYFLFLILQQMRFGSMSNTIFRPFYTRLPTCSSLSTYSLQKKPSWSQKNLMCFVIESLFPQRKTSCLYHLCSMFALSRNWEMKKNNVRVFSQRHKLPSS